MFGDAMIEKCWDAEHGPDCVILRDGFVELHLPHTDATAIVARQQLIDAQFHAREAERRKSQPKHVPVGFCFY